MIEPEKGTKVILIGGTSHAGKSTLAQAIASKLGWEYRSTDSLARHPGRPWKTPEKKQVPPHVIEHYSTLSVDELIEDVLRHYRQNVMPQVQAIVNARVADSTLPGIVLEGSALWPEFVTEMKREDFAALWLGASGPFIEKRIRQNSGFSQLPEHERPPVEKFIKRSVAYNQRMKAEIERLGLIWIEVEFSTSLADLTKKCMDLLNIQARTA